MAKRVAGKRGRRPVDDANGTGRPADVDVLQSLVTEMLWRLVRILAPAGERSRGRAPAPKAAAPAAAARAGEYGPVQRGDTLSKIAQGNKPDGVTLDQMLVSLYRANPDAFDGKNMNRLKTGKILRVPTAEQAAEVTTGEAAKEVRVQVADWNGYRQKLAEAPADDGRLVPGVSEPGYLTALDQIGLGRP